MSGGDGHWTDVDYERRKRRFIDSRMLHRSVYTHASLIFALTLAAGWVTSWALRVEGLANMPLRYAASFAAAYAVFLLLVRAWSSFMHSEEGSGAGPSNALDVADLGIDAGEGGCAVIVVVAVVGLLLAGLFALMGGMPMLLEIAFEVVFAGVVVRRARKTQVIGDWLGAALAKTWLPALAAGAILVAVAAVAQHKVPEARTMGEAVRAWLAQP